MKGLSMKKLLSFILFLSILISPLAGLSQEESKTKADAQSTNKTQSGATVAATQPKPALEFGLAEDTPVRLRINRTISSGTEKVNDKVDFTVVEAVKVGDVVVIPQGALAIATVTEAKPKGRLGKAGKLNVNIDYVQLASGEKVALRAVKGGKGGSRTGVMTGALVATSILFFPAAPFFLFMKGKNIIVPKGTEITAYVAADTPLDREKFVNTQIASSTVSDAQSQPGMAETKAFSTVIVKSSPDGAEITISGKYVGSTPSTLQLEPGEHTIVLEKSGYKSWQRTVAVNSGGSITVDATLEKAQ
jgi:hypothetical protein